MNQIYNEQNVVAIKRDLQSLGKQIEVAHTHLGEANAELAIVRSEIREERDFLARFRERIAAHLSRFTNFVFEAKKELEETEKHRANVIEAIKLLKEGVRKVEHIPDTNFGFVRDVIDRFSNTISFLDSQISMKTEQVSEIEERKKLTEEEAEDLAEYKVQLEKDIEALSVELGITDEKKKKALKALMSAQAEIDHIHERDHDSRIMAHRLSKEYQEVYNQLPHRKK